MALPPRHREFVESNCVTCHDDTESKGGVRLDQLSADFSDPATARLWIDIYDQLSTGHMPPKKKPRPAKAQADETIAWIRDNLTRSQLAARKADGRVVLRRLNRAEYANSVRDLLSIDAELEDLLPEDTASMGFDNVAAALSMSSVLMERYLEAADVALDAIIQTGPRPETKSWDVAYGPVSKNPNDYRFKTGVEALPDGTWVMYNNGENSVNCDRFKAPIEGDYQFRLSVFGYRTEQPLVMSLIAGSFDTKNPRRKTVGYFDVPAAETGKTQAYRTIEFTEHLQKNGTLHVITHHLGRRQLDTPALLSAYNGPGVAIAPLHAEGPLFASWPPEGHRALFGDLDFKTATMTDAEAVLKKFASRAFRRSATSSDIAPMLALVQKQFDAKQPFEVAIRPGIKGILCSPAFLFLWEQPGKLTAHSIASRLSYFRWSSTPDDELLRLAADGSLTRPDMLRAQTERLLQDPRASQFVQNFTGQWLMLRQIDFTTPDKKLYPEFDETLQWSMPQETRGFFQELLQKDLGIANLIDSDWTMLNSRLAALYGIPGVTGLEMRRAPLTPESHHGGLLGQAALLKVTANGTSTSPVVRG